MPDPTPAPDAAVQIVMEACARDVIMTNRGYAERVVAALARAGMLCEPGEVTETERMGWNIAERLTARVAELEAAVHAYVASLPAKYWGSADLERLRALDAAPAPEVALPAEMAERARRHPNGAGLPSAPDDQAELAARLREGGEALRCGVCSDPIVAADDPGSWWHKFPPARGEVDDHDAVPAVLDAAPAGITAEQESAFTELVRLGQEIERDAAGVVCDRCLPGEHGERVDVHTFGQQPCGHVAPTTRENV